ncbi:MAG: CDP-alcohol phosphatidyltransferase family protein [Acidimicrobiales bacterium]
MNSAAEVSFIGTSRWSRAANSLTVLRITSAPVLALLVLAKNPWWLTFWFGWFLGATDYLDGQLARRAAPTRVGAFLDPLADKVVVLLVGYALVWVDRFGWVPVTIIAVREVAIIIYRSHWGRRGLAIPARRSAKYKTLVQGVALAAAMCPALDDALWVADGLLWIAVGFTLVTGMQYATDGRGALRTTGER